jgi:hypothetical protein
LDFDALTHEELPQEIDHPLAFLIGRRSQCQTPLIQQTGVDSNRY